MIILTGYEGFIGKAFDRESDISIKPNEIIELEHFQGIKENDDKYDYNFLLPLYVILLFRIKKLIIKIL